MQNIDAVFDSLVSGDFLRVLSFLDEPRLRQSLTLVSFTRLLPIGEPPNR